MKIFVNARFLTQPVSGVQRYAIECCKKIKKKYPTTVFLSPPHILHTDVAEELGAKVIGTNNGHRWEQWDLPRYLRKQGSPPLWSPCNTAPLVYGNNYVTLHDLAFRFYPQWNSRMFSTWYNFLAPRLAKSARHLFTVSETVKKEIIREYGVSPAKVSITYNGIAEHMMSGEVGIRHAKEKMVLAVGSFNKRKNHHLLIDAFRNSELRHTHRLVLVGDKSRVFREANIDESVLSGNNIIIREGVNDAELRQLYRHAEIVAALSAYEGFGIPVLEGLYYGCKLVCSDIPVYHELYEGAVTFCNTEMPDSIIASLERAAMSNPISDLALGLLLQKYNYEKSAEEVGRVMTAD